MVELGFGKGRRNAAEVSFMHGRSRLCHLFCAVILAGIVSSSPASSAGALDEQLVWMDAQSPSRLMFIPERILNSVDLGDLPLNDSDRKSILSLLTLPEYRRSYKARTGRDVPICTTLHTDDRVKNAHSLGALLREQPLVFFGTVLEVVPGWNVWSSSPSGMVYIKPDSTLRGSAGAGSVVMLPQHGGLLNFKGVEVCTKTSANFFQPKAGDRLLVLGESFHSNPEVLPAPYVFPILNGAVQAQPYPGVEDFKAVPVKDIHGLMAREDGSE